MSNRPTVFCFLFALFYAVSTQQFVDDSCTLGPSKVPGFCKRPNDCEEVFQKLTNNSNRIFPTICFFEGSSPVVCCPKRPGDISRIQCKKYSSYVNLVQTFGTTKISIPQCGQSKAQELIFGGKPVAEKEFPHMALLGYDSPDGEISCGGSIISESYILTAAHCLFPLSGNISVVRVGITNLNDTKHRQEMKVGKVIPHPEYKSKSFYNDIGLIKLENPINLNPYARPACLHSRREVSEKALVTGWGFTDGNAAAISDKLLKAKLSIIQHDSCNSTYKRLINRKLNMGIIDYMQICAGTEDGSMDTCMGDSGGPLQIYHNGDDIKCMYDIIGVTSFGQTCPSLTGVYVRVSHYVQWIEDIVWP